MYKLLQVFQQPVTEGPGVYSTSTHLWEIIIMLLGAAILGYLLRYFSKPQAAPEKTDAKTLVPATPEVNEWETKYKSFQANYEQNKAEWQQKYKSSEDRAKTYQGQLVEMKTAQEKLSAEKTEFISKLRAMEAQRNEALDSAKRITTELLGAVENIKTQQEKINSLSSALAMASNVKKEMPKPMIISDEELTKKYETDTASLKKQLEEKDKKVIALLSKEAAANELQLRNDKLASENRILRSEMAAADLDTDAAIEKAQQLKDLQLQVLSLSNKVALAHGETATLKKQLAEQQKRHHQQAGKLNELRMAIGQERATAKAKLEELESELATFKPVPETVAVAETEQTIEPVAPVIEVEKAAPLVEQKVINSPEIDVTPVVVDIPAPLVREVLPETKSELFVPESPTEAFVSPKAIETSNAEPAVTSSIFPVDKEADIEPIVEESATFPIDTHKITIPETSEETPAGKQNDLLSVQGIDVKVKALLETEGIDSWGKLAKTSAAALKTILTEKGSEAFATINPKSWPIQAQLLADGKWDAFASYTKYLIGGVDPSEVNT